MIRLNIPPSLRDTAKAQARACGSRLIWNDDEKRWFFPGDAREVLPEGLRPFYAGVVATASTALAPAPSAVAAGAAVALDGHCQFHVLTISGSPYFATVAEAYGVRKDPRWRVKYWYGDKRRMPAPLRGYEPKPFSYEQYVENQINSRPAPTVAPSGSITLREHQQAGIVEIYRAFAAGYSGFLLADEVGLGKTISGWGAVLQLFRTPINVAIVAPLSVHPGWRSTIERMGNGGHTVVILNYERLRLLYNEPEDTAKVAHNPRRMLKHIATAGTPKPFHLIIFDEAHYIKNLESARTQLAVGLYRGETRTLWLSATAGQSAIELGYLLPILEVKTTGRLRGAGAPTHNDFARWYKAADVGVSRGPYGNWQAATEDDERRKHCRHMAEILWTPDKNGVRIALRRTPEELAGWPSLQRIPWAVELDVDEMRQYETDWAQFLIEFRREKEQKPAHPHHASSANPGSAALLRFRMKASLLRAKHTARFAAELVESGHQVAISVQWEGTLNAIIHELTELGLPYARITGREMGEKRELERKRYQTGDAKVVLFTIEAGISLHQGETGGNNVPRSQIDHDIRFSAIAMHQIDGRSQRDGKFARSYWAFAAGTREENVAMKLLDKLKSMKALMGETDYGLDELENAFIGDGK